MPAGLVHQHNAVRARRHRLRQLDKKQVHRSGIDPRHHQCDAGVARRAHGANDPGRLETDIAQPAGGLAALPPDIAGAPLLPDPRLVLAPDLKPLGLGVRPRDLAQAGSKAPLYEAPCVNAYGSSAVRRLNEFGIGLAWSVCGEAPHHLISGRLASEPAPTSRMLGEVARSRRTGPIFLTAIRALGAAGPRPSRFGAGSPSRMPRRSLSTPSIPHHQELARHSDSAIMRRSVCGPTPRV